MNLFTELRHTVRTRNSSHQLEHSMTYFFKPAKKNGTSAQASLFRPSSNVSIFIQSLFWRQSLKFAVCWWFPVVLQSCTLTAVWVWDIFLSARCFNALFNYTFSGGNWKTRLWNISRRQRDIDRSEDGGDGSHSRCGEKQWKRKRTGSCLTGQSECWMCGRGPSLLLWLRYCN